MFHYNKHMECQLARGGKLSDKQNDFSELGIDNREGLCQKQSGLM